MKQTVVLTAELPRIATEILARNFEVITHPADDPRLEAEMIEIVADADGIVTILSDPITRKVLETNPNLRVVGNYAVGTNNIDLAAAEEHGVAVTNTPGVLTDATADLTMALILAVTRHVIRGDRMVREGRFHGWHPLMLLGPSLQGKRLGIVGMGRIGCAVAKRAAAFGMEIVYYSRGRHEGCEQTTGAKRIEIRELIATSDVISLHAPLTPATRHLIDRKAIMNMKPTAIVINTGRGPVIDEEALAEALEHRRIAGAGLDVYEHEPNVHPRLLPLDNVVLLPHLGSATEEARNEMAAIVAHDVTAVLMGREPKHRVR